MSATDAPEDIAIVREELLEGSQAKNEGLLRSIKKASARGCTRRWLVADAEEHSQQHAARCIYGPTPFARHLIIDVRKNHCSHISGLFVEDFYFLAPMVVCAHYPHHASGLYVANARTRF